MSLPILYSFRRCPYAMRARLALMHSGARCEIREVVLKNKPNEMLIASSKGTVPILVLGDKVIDESIDIMLWALHENPARNLASCDSWQLSDTLSQEDIRDLIQQTDNDFKARLDKYKYCDRYPERSQEHYLKQALPFLEKLEALLNHSPYLMGNQFGIADAAILPFVRQFSMVNLNVFNALPLPNLQRWLESGINSALFESIMEKLPPWQANSNERPVVFGQGIQNGR